MFVRATHAKDKDCMNNITFIQSISEKNLYSNNPRKVIRHMTSDFDVCEVEWICK